MKCYLIDLISTNQNAFNLGRSISKNSLLMYEMVRSFNNKNSSNLCVKIDFHKAYDKINRGFIHHMLINMNSFYIFAKLVQECIYTTSFYVLINGSAYGYFERKRGLRQGYPLSLYLFSIARNISYSPRNRALTR